MFDQETLQEILGIKEKVYTKPLEMANKMNVTFFPYYSKNLSSDILSFRDKLEKIFNELNVNIVPYEEALTTIPLTKVWKNVIKIIFNNILFKLRDIFGFPQSNHYFDLNAIKYLFKNTKIKKGISVIVLGEQSDENLPMQFIYSFKDNSIVTIIDFPKNISENSTFHEHFDTALDLFTRNMTNIVIGVNAEKWLLYNFNASHPVFSINDNFKENVLHALVPKIVAPIRPYKLSEFQILKNKFDINENKRQVDDLVKGALLFSETSLYPKGKKIDDLPFRNDFYRWIGKLHLDNRNGMSYGFLAIQLPGKVYPLIPAKKFNQIVNQKVESQFFYFEDNLHIQVEIDKEHFWIRVPDVWVLSQRSGSDKTHVNPQKDLIKMGLSNGKMYLQTHDGMSIDNDYKTSFDTQVILAHSVGNAIIASIINHKSNIDSEFLNRYLRNGISISHWHGYIHPESVPAGWYVHGVTNPHVACSSPQSAIYAIQGKLESFLESLKTNTEYKGDIHIEPHHGTNVCFTSITDLAKYLVDNPKASILGNSYFYLYNKNNI